MARILFSKQASAVWISHLDLMRVLQRAFRRAGMLLKHSQGYTPHPCLSIVLPLSVGVSSDCELMDFELAEGQTATCPEIVERLNAVLPAGIRVLCCAPDTRKIKELRWLEAELTLEYDAGVPDGAAQAISTLFARDTLTVEKRRKDEVSTVDLIPMLHSVAISVKDANTLTLRAVVSAQNPTLNPLLLATAMEAYLPSCKPDFSKCRRICLYDAEMQNFF